MTLPKEITLEDQGVIPHVILHKYMRFLKTFFHFFIFLLCHSLDHIYFSQGCHYNSLCM